MDGVSTNYARLADAELEAAGVASDGAAKDYHLNRASVFAYLGDSHDQGLSKSLSLAAIGKVLVCAMALADAAGLPVVSIHIDAALVALESGTEHTAV